MAGHPGDKETDGGPHTTPERNLTPSRDEVPDSHSRETGVEDVTVQATRQHPDVEALEDSRRTAAEDADEIEDVLHDREAQPAYGPIHEPVHHVVDLVHGDEADHHHARGLQRLLGDGGGERSRPSRGEFRPAHPSHHEAPPAVRQSGKRGGGDGAPHKRSEDQCDRLALVQVEEVDGQEHGERIDDQEGPGQRPAGGRDPAEDGLFGKGVDAGADDDHGIRPEGRFPDLEQRDLPTPAAAGQRHAGGLGHRQRILAVSIIVWMSPET